MKDASSHPIPFSFSRFSGSGVLQIGFALAVIAFAPQGVLAQKFTVLHSFTGGEDGAHPKASLVRDAEGNLYGVAYDGGKFGYGTAFKLDSAGKFAVLHAFAGAKGDGANPTAGLVLDSEGNLYGTTQYGGDFKCYGKEGCGSIFKLSADGHETVLYRFGGGAALPSGNLILDSEGNLYGTAYSDETSGSGAVYKVSKSGTLTLLYQFTGLPDGQNPYAGPVEGGVKFYGTTVNGGTGKCIEDYGSCGTVFEVDKEGTERVLYDFGAGSVTGDGANPYGEVIRDNSGNLYGTTQYGGSYGWGTIFALSPAGVEKVLYSFTGGADGGQPWATLVRDSQGNFYGTTGFGGTGAGVVFKLDSSGKETVLHIFSGDDDGALPLAGLIIDSQGALYGTTTGGGKGGKGVIFKLVP